MEPGDQAPRLTYFRSVDVLTGTVDIHTDSNRMLLPFRRKRKITSTLTFLGGCFAATDI